MYVMHHIYNAHIKSHSILLLIYYRYAMNDRFDYLHAVVDWISHYFLILCAMQSIEVAEDDGHIDIKF